MDKLPCETPNQTDQNIEKIAALFPNVITEIKDEEHSTPEKTVYKKGINFELLKQELSGDVADGDECYDFTWVGKKACIVEGNKPIKKTLRPCMEESKDWEHTGNLYIEGDNLDVLKLLQESYLNSVKMIYIDPPYNTGNDFIYKDDFAMDKDDYDEQISLYDDDGNRLFQNTESNGRFHSDWCSMMYPRLKLAQNLLTDDGVIFISIDDNEVHNLRKMCDEVFGEGNFVSMLTVVVKPEGRRYGFFAKTHEFVLVYCKNSYALSLNEVEVKGTTFQYSDNRGGYNLIGLRNRNVQAFNSSNRPNLRYPFYVDINHADSNGLFPVSTVEREGHIKIWPSTINGLESVWRWGREKSTLQADDLVAYRGNDGEIRVFQKERKLTQTAKTVLNDKNYISNKGTKEVQQLLGKGIFDFPKPLALIKILASIGSMEESIVLDFFSGSATTAHALMQLNAEDGGNRKFIMTQIPELCDGKSDAFKAGYKNICEIGKERIRRAGEKIKAKVEEENAQLKLGEEPKQVPDIGFRVLKLDETNMKDVYYSAEEYSQTTLENMESNIKEGRTDLDLLYGVLLDWGLKLTDNHKIVELNGVRVHCYNFDAGTCLDSGLPRDCALMACFADKVGEDVIRAIAKSEPQRAVFRDSSFTDSPEKINVTEIFKLLAPDTSVKVI